MRFFSFVIGHSLHIIPSAQLPSYHIVSCACPRVSTFPISLHLEGLPLAMATTLPLSSVSRVGRRLYADKAGSCATTCSTQHHRTPARTSLTTEGSSVLRRRHPDLSSTNMDTCIGIGRARIWIRVSISEGYGYVDTAIFQITPYADTF